MRFRSMLLGLVLITGHLTAQSRPRARDLGVPFDGTPGPLNAITDVAGVTVGHATIIKGQGTLVVGQGPVRTGVTAIFPRGATNGDPVFGGWFTLNGNGEMTGTTWLEESGFLAGPVMITNTHSVGVVRDAVIEWLVRKGFEFDWSLPIVAETWDGSLNDINGFHVTKQHAFAALDSARGGPVVEGSVGGGTGMVCNQFKGGIGTASRRLDPHDGGYTLGVLVQCNYGRRRYLRIAGAPVGQEIADLVPCRVPCSGPRSAWAGWAGSRPTRRATSSSRSRRPTPAPPGIPGSRRFPWCRTSRSLRCSRRRCRPPKRRSSTPCSRPGP